MEEGSKASLSSHNISENALILKSIHSTFLTAPPFHGHMAMKNNRIGRHKWPREDCITEEKSTGDGLLTNPNSNSVLTGLPAAETFVSPINSTFNSSPFSLAPEY